MLKLLLIIVDIYFLLTNAQIVDPRKRVDCYPDSFDYTEERCLARNCTNTNDEDKSINNPICYFPTNTGYFAEGSLDVTTITLKKSPTSAKNPYGQDFDELIFQVDEIGSGLHVTISPKNQTRYRPLINVNLNPNISSQEKLSVVKTNDSIFSFSIQRSSGIKIWDTSIGGLLFADKYLQIATYLPTDKIYGFGENTHYSLKHNLSFYKTWAMFTKDDGANAENRNLYGVHPFYLGLEEDGKAHGVFLFNSNAQEITTGPAPHLVYRTIGGQLEFFFFPGPTPEQVIQQYQQVIGTPFLPAYWALGFHICRYGYHGTSDVATVVNRTWAAQIPFDVAWADIDYMDEWKDFTLSSTNWSDFGNYTNYLHQQGMHVMLITDPAVEVDYPTFQRGIEMNASFIEWPSYDLVPKDINNQYPLTNGTKFMLGGVWPVKHVAFPDFLDPTEQTFKWWSNEFSIFRQTVALDGFWIDMNEPDNFGTAFNSSLRSTKIQKWPTNQPLVCPDGNDPNGEYDNPPYWTASGYTFGHLASGTLCMCAMTARGTNRFYDTKNLYGTSEAMATAYAQKNAVGKRGAVISRSTFPTSGSYAGHWTGDNNAFYVDLQYSIIKIQEFNMFGIPFVGADICGFNGEHTTEELCLRWSQLGAFYPFSRNHNNYGRPPHDPALWPDVAAAARKAHLFRYRHLPYLYSLMFSSTLYGGTVARPVFFEFPTDPLTYELSYQFLWGPALMIVPVIEGNVTTVSGYLPAGSRWYSVYDYFYGSEVNSGPSNFTAPPDYLIPVFVRGGYILPRQRPAVTTTLARQNELQLLVALDANNTASGELYWDDGETLVNNISTYNNYHFNFNFMVQTASAALNITMTKQATNLTLQSLDNLEILGYPYNPDLKSAKLNGQPVTINTGTSSYSPFTKLLNITTTNFINLNVNGPVWVLTWNNQ